jgi:hypothetical protein
MSITSTVAVTKGSKYRKMTYSTVFWCAEQRNLDRINLIVSRPADVGDGIKNRRQASHLLFAFVLVLIEKISTLSE